MKQDFSQKTKMVADNVPTVKEEKMSVSVSEH